MKNKQPTAILSPLILQAATAGELMVPNPVSIGEKAAVKEAIVFLSEKGFTAAPVIDDAGRPVGVVSQSDIVRYEREQLEGLVPAPDDDEQDLVTPEGEPLGNGFHAEHPNLTPVRDIMTPTVFAAAPETPAREVVNQMLARKVHRLFVVDGAGVLVGVISALDILRNLR